MQDIPEINNTVFVEPNYTQAAFSEGVEYAGLFMQIIGASVLAVVLVVLFFLLQTTKARKDRNRSVL